MLAEAEVLLASRELRAALAMFHRAEAAGEDEARCRGGRWQAYMLLGQFEEAWRESDAIRASAVPDPHRFWKGEDLSGKRVLLRCLHGLGDAVQFLRYVPLIASRAAHLTLQVPPVMLELASCFEGVNNVISWSSLECPEPVWDMQIEINELPYVFRTEMRDLPINQEYLTLSTEVLPDSLLPARKADRFHVGLVWSCGAWDRTRAVPFSLVRPLLDTPECEFWNLQGGTKRNECPPHVAVHQAEECDGNLLHLAALVSQLDLVITPDTLAAHLAGALGVPAFVLLQHAADWRWLLARSDSPWYSSIRLFRQPRPGDWNAVMQNVQDALVCQTRRKLAA